jgi:hypothetical protein
MEKAGEISDKGKKLLASRDKETDFTRIAAKEKLTLDPQRDILKGGSGEGSSGQNTRSAYDKAVKTKNDDVKYVSDMYEDHQINNNQYQQGRQAATQRFLETVSKIPKPSENQPPAKIQKK